MTLIPYNYISLISESDIKDFSLIDMNLSSDYLYPILRFVQDNKMNRILGEYMYNDLLYNYSASTLSDDYNYILNNQIKQIIIWGILSEIQIPLNFKFRNQGMFQTQNPDGTNMLLQDIEYTKSFYERICKYYEDDLINYLCYYSEKYPLYKLSNTYSMYNTNKNNFNCNITL